MKSSEQLRYEADIEASDSRIQQMRELLYENGYPAHYLQSFIEELIARNEPNKSAPLDEEPYG